ncbi:MAG: hypothetical protein LUD74_06235, partial [Tannerellaceae bacterium]|nr:hypothetical protein [Tannerellaceae bacterium]
RVELIRDLANVEVFLRKSVAGSTAPENTLTSVLLENVAGYISVPPWTTIIPVRSYLLPPLR